MKYFLFVLALLFSVTGKATISTMVADTRSGFIISSYNADELQHPASLTKVMTLYLTFDALENGLLKMDDKLPISEHAAKQPRSKMFLKAGDTITVREAIMALIVKSANDAAVVLAEALAPSEEEFARLMTGVAHELGMKNTTFKNASGLHHPDQITTAKDMGILTIALINHYPQYYKLFSKKSFVYRGKEYQGHNALLKQYKGAEGLKTGFISAVGYNIITTAKKNNTRLVGVVIGQNTAKARDKQVANLLDKGFKKVGTYRTVRNSPLNKKAIVQTPRRNLYLPRMKESILQAHELSVAYQQRTTNEGLLGVSNLEFEDFTTTAQGDVIDSWAIQVGAFSSEKTAQKRAEQALAYIGKLGKTIETQPNNHLFRSRIKGFTSKEQANNACKLLNSKKIQCLPIAPFS